MEKIFVMINFLRYNWSIKAGGFFYILAFPSIKGLHRIKIGKHFFANRFLRIEVIGTDTIKLFIGDHVSLGENVHLAVTNKIIIGDNVLMGSRILITDHNHGKYNGIGLSDPDSSPQSRELISDGPVIIEKNVWIGDGVVILPNITIGKSSIVGANSVVNKSVPPYSIVGGIPAKIIKQYNFTSKSWEKVLENKI